MISSRTGLRLTFGAAFGLALLFPPSSTAHGRPAGPGDGGGGPADEARCLSLRHLVPSTPTDPAFPEDWIVRPVGSDGHVSDGGSVVYGAWHVVESLRRHALSPGETISLEIRTPSGGFEVVYALYPSGGDAADLESARVLLSKIVRGRGLAARFYGRVLMSAATRDREALTVLGESLVKRMAGRVLEFAEAAEARGHSGALTRCVEEFLEIQPRNAPMHMSLGLYFLDRADPPDPSRGLASLARSLSSEMSPALTPPQKWVALHAKGTAELLLGEVRDARSSLRGAVGLAPGEAERAASQFNLAAAEATLGNRDDALELLRESFATNRRLGRPPGVQAASRDVAFQSLADDPEFVRLLEEFRP